MSQNERMRLLGVMFSNLRRTSCMSAEEGSRITTVMDFPSGQFGYAQ